MREIPSKGKGRKKKIQVYPANGIRIEIFEERLYTVPSRIRVPEAERLSSLIIVPSFVRREFFISLVPARSQAKLLFLREEFALVNITQTFGLSFRNSLSLSLSVRDNGCS